MELIKHGIELILNNKDHDHWEKRTEGLTKLQVRSLPCKLKLIFELTNLVALYSGVLSVMRERRIQFAKLPNQGTQTSIGAYGR